MIYNSMDTSSRIASTAIYIWYIASLHTANGEDTIFMVLLTSVAPCRHQLSQQYLCVVSTNNLTLWKGGIGGVVP